jgi:hypothetical protein
MSSTSDFRLITEVDPAAFVPMKMWGRDHWSTLAYLETRCVDYNGSIQNLHLRCDPQGRHPQFAHVRNGGDYNTRLQEGKELTGHDDWDCIEDMIREGLVTWEGTGLNPVFRLTDRGIRIAHALRAHKLHGGNFGSFKRDG